MFRMLVRELASIIGLLGAHAFHANRGMMGNPLGPIHLCSLPSVWWCERSESAVIALLCSYMACVKFVTTADC